MINYAARNNAVVITVIGLAIVSPFLAIGFGAAEITYYDVIAAVCNSVGGECDISPIKQRIIIELRMPRVILAFLAGAGLSLAGAVLQNVTRNPLADPFLFGVSTGASFGAVLVIAAVGSGSGVITALGIPMGAFLGSALSIMLVVSLAGNGVQIERMLLAGVAVSYMFGAATSLVLYSSDPQAAASLLFWSLGSFTRAQWGNLLLPSVIIGVGLVVFIGYGRQLRAILAGDESARALGVDVNRLRVGMLLLSSLMTAVLVANCGGIGFVGLMVPHLVRRLMGTNTEFTLVIIAVFGGLFMIWVDVLARQLLSDGELPVGVITAAIGSVFFLIVLRRRSWLDG
jgi:iron complex transport system permease protein